MTSPFSPSLRFVALVALMMLAACGTRGDKGPVRVDVIGRSVQMAEPLDNGSNAAGQTVLAATAQGLIAFDAGGELVGGLAERWVVEEDGRSYLFRLRHIRWADGGIVTAGQVAELLRSRFKAYPAIVAGLDPQVRGMTEEVLEVRLQAPLPSFLQMLAHPAMAIARHGVGTGPFRARGKDVMTLSAIRSGDATPAPDGKDAATQHLFFLRPVRAALGFARFERNYSDLLLGGRFQHLPYIVAADLPSGAVRTDPVNGLLGLMVEGASPFFADRDVRAALSSALDRASIVQGFGLSGWHGTTALLPAPLDLGRAPTQPPWASHTLEGRRAFARSVIAAWTRRTGQAPPVVRIALPVGPGAHLLYDALRRDYAALGLSAQLVSWDAPADLHLIDEVAPFDSAIWYLARVGCGPNRLCDPDAEAALDRARNAATDSERAAALGEAEALALAEANYIPIAMPVRFALVRARLTGYLPSPRARHPLNALFRVPR